MESEDFNNWAVGLSAIGTLFFSVWFTLGATDRQEIGRRIVAWFDPYRAARKRIKIANQMTWETYELLSVMSRYDWSGDAKQFAQDLAT